MTCALLLAPLICPSVCAAARTLTLRSTTARVCLIAVIVCRRDAAVSDLGSCKEVSAGPNIQSHRAPTRAADEMRLGCGARLTGRNMRAHFTICPKRPAGSDVEHDGGPAWTASGTADEMRLGLWR